MKPIRISRRLGETLTVEDMERAYANGYVALCQSGKVKKLFPERRKAEIFIYKHLEGATNEWTGPERCIYI